jgi:GTPase SAR1 family protein
MRDLYYKNGDGFLLVYSITDLSSLEDVKERFQSLLTQRVSSSPPHPALLQVPQIPREDFNLIIMLFMTRQKYSLKDGPTLREFNDEINEKISGSEILKINIL